MSNDKPGQIDDGGMTYLRTVYACRNKKILKRDTKKRIAVFEQDMAECLELLDEEHARAYMVYLQGRNFLAELIKLPQIEAPDKVLKSLPEYAHLFSVETLRKHIAIVCSDEDATLASIDSWLRLFGKTGYRLYSDLSLVAEAIQENLVNGIVHLRAKDDLGVDVLIRNDLVDYFYFSHQRAAKLLLPRIETAMLGESLYEEILSCIDHLQEDDENPEDIENL